MFDYIGKYFHALPTIPPLHQRTAALSGNMVVFRNRQYLTYHSPTRKDISLGHPRS
jgi:hypothetical protein